MKGKIKSFIMNNLMKIVLFMILYIVLLILLGFRISLGVLSIVIIYSFIKWSEKAPVIKIEEKNRVEEKEIEEKKQL